MSDISEPQPQGPEGYVQCEITGKWLPADETIEIQGVRVGAEGKQILLDQLRSGESTSADEKPTVLRRFCCMFVDGIIFVVMLIPFGVAAGVIIAAVASRSGAKFNFETFETYASLWSQITAIPYGLAVLAYLTYFHGVIGQTPGKMAGQLFVVNPDGSPIGVKKAFLRAVFYHGPSMLMSLLVLLTLVLLPAAFMDIVEPVTSLIGFLYVFVSVIFALIDTKQQRALHDIFAKTRVVHVDKD